MVLNIPFNETESTKTNELSSEPEMAAQVSNTLHLSLFFCSTSDSVSKGFPLLKIHVIYMY